MRKKEGGGGGRGGGRLAIVRSARAETKSKVGN